LSAWSKTAVESFGGLDVLHNNATDFATNAVSRFVAAEVDDVNGIQIVTWDVRLHVRKKSSLVD
jgi:hypothetical protein